MNTKSYQIKYHKEYDDGKHMPWSVYRNDEWFASYSTEQEAIDCVASNIHLDMHFDILGNRISETENAAGRKS